MYAYTPCRWLTKGLVLAALLLALRVAAQETSATCTLPSFQWSFNSENQSSCAVASSLLGVCSETTVAALPNSNSEYLGPAINDANPCQCNTVVYSLMSACALCQNATIITWSEWATNCFPIYTSFPQPIPAGLRVPAFAYLDVESQDIFNASAAKLDANATESTALPSSSTVAATAPTSSIVQTSTPTSVSTSDSLKTADHRINTIANSAIGGILGLAVFLLSIGVFVALRRRRRRRADQMSSEESEGFVPSMQEVSSHRANLDPSKASSLSDVGLPPVHHETVSQNIPSFSVSSSSVGSSR